MQSHSILLAAILALIEGVAGAVPPSGNMKAGNPGTFSVKQVRNPNFIRRGPLQLAKVYHKYHTPLPADLKSAVDRIRNELQSNSNPKSKKKAARVTGSAETTPEESDVEYLTPVSLGTPGQVLNLDIDTGSSDLWVFSTETSKSDISGQVLYDANKSSTAQKLQGYTWEISYGDGSSSSGDVYTDSVTVGGLMVSPQAVEVAKKVSDAFTSDPDNDGLLGLGFSSINTVQPVAQKTFFDNAKSGLDSPVFTADLKAGAPGHYNFGFIDPNSFSGALTYTPVDNSNGFWAFTPSGYAIGSSGSFTNTTSQAIADTGTSLLLLPSTVVSSYYAQVTGAFYDATQGGYTLPCSGSQPDFFFGLGDAGAKIRVPGKYMAYAPTSANGQTCFGGIQPDTGIGFSIYGDVAFKAAFVVFDAGKVQLGWASKALH